MNNWTDPIGEASAYSHSYYLTLFGLPDVPGSYQPAPNLAAK